MCDKTLFVLIWIWGLKASRGRSYYCISSRVGRDGIIFVGRHSSSLILVAKIIVVLSIVCFCGPDSSGRSFYVDRSISEDGSATGSCSRHNDLMTDLHVAKTTGTKRT